MSRDSCEGETVATPRSQPHFGENSKFGAMFVWSGCICQALWACAAFTVSAGPTWGDFAPVFLYSALAAAGLALIASDPERRQSRNLTAGRFSDQGGPTYTQAKSCRVMTIGPLAPVQSVLLLVDRSILVGHVETAGKALEKLASLSTTRDSPDVLIMPSWLPIMTSPDLIRAIKSDRALKPMHIIVWGTNMPVKEIQSLYDAGATCVIPMPHDGSVPQALRRFCQRLSVSDSHTAETTDRTEEA